MLAVPLGNGATDLFASPTKNPLQGSGSLTAGLFVQVARETMFVRYLFSHGNVPLELL
jgi:hypothetical protein